MTVASSAAPHGISPTTGRVPRGSLDLLVIDEAGQYSLANTIAVASAAKSLLLLGDPQQLPQVSQGTHPEPVDTSALGWLIDGRHTCPQSSGTSSSLSYRMHPDVCARCRGCPTTIACARSTK